MKPNAGSSAVKAAAKAVAAAKVGLTSREVAEAIGCKLQHTQKCLTVLTHEGLAKACKDGARHTIWMTPERADAHTAAIRAARPAKKRESERLRALANPRKRAAKNPKPKPVKPQGFDFSLSDEQWHEGIRRSIVPAVNAARIKAPAVRWVFDLGRAA